MSKTLRGALLASALATLAPFAAQAATVTIGTMPTAAAPNAIATSTTGTVYQNTTGSISGVKADAWGGTAFAGSAYTAVLGGGSATYATGPASSFSFVWGSPDSYNTLEFLRDGKVVDSVMGTFGSNSSNYFVTLQNIAGGLFDAVRFVSTGNAFEFADVSVAPVPVPAAGLMLLTAFGGIAALRRRKTA